MMVGVRYCPPQEWVQVKTLLHLCSLRCRAVYASGPSSNLVLDKQSVLTKQKPNDTD